MLGTKTSPQPILQLEGVHDLLNRRTDSIRVGTELKKGDVVLV